MSNSEFAVIASEAKHSRVQRRFWIASSLTLLAMTWREGMSPQSHSAARLSDAIA
jgi:hypothetical protein